MHVENTKTAENSKKIRMQTVQELGFIEISSSNNRIVVNYFAKNLKKIQDYITFLSSIKSDLIKLLKSAVKKKSDKIQFKTRGYISQSQR